MLHSRFAESRKASPGMFCVSETNPGWPYLDKEERRGLALEVMVCVIFRRQKRAQWSRGWSEEDRGRGASGEPRQVLGPDYIGHCRHARTVHFILSHKRFLLSET